MAKKRTLNKGRIRIRNAHLIGKGGKQLRPINGSYLKSYNKIYGKAKSKVQNKAKVIKAPSKSNNVRVVQRKPTLYAKSAKASKVRTTRMKGLHKMKERLRNTPSTSLTMQKRKLMKRKPPTKGRGR